MFKKTLGLWILIFALPGADSSCAKAADATGPMFTVAVYNQAGAPAEALAQAETVAGHIFREAGLQVNWLNCGVPGESEEQIQSCLQAVFPTHLQVRIVRHAISLSEAVFGISYLAEDGSGCYSDVFFVPMKDLSERLDLNPGRVLGHVIAHEIAHLLLGPKSHTPKGIMRRYWQPEDLTDMVQGRLLFTRQDAEVMRRRFSHGNCAAKDAVKEVSAD